MQIKTIKCPCCDGSGEVPDQAALGDAMRKARETAKISLRQMAKRISKSPTFLSALEVSNGTVKWPKEVLHAYIQELNKEPRKAKARK